MNLKNLYLLLTSFIFLYSCAEYKVSKPQKGELKSYYSSKGFVLIYDEDLLKNKIINKKIHNEKLQIIHKSLKKNTPVQITNPNNSKSVKTKIFKTGVYPNIFNAVISKEIALTLELDDENPYVEIIEIKKNETFIAKKANTFEEERNVAGKAPIDEVKMDDLTTDKNKLDGTTNIKSIFTLVVNDFYYEDSANNLKKELIKKTGIDNFSVKKINNTKYRLLAGPFKNFNALKTTYISLNNLGFENLDIYKD